MFFFQLAHPCTYSPISPLVPDTLNRAQCTMSEVRIAVEWLFGDVIDSLKFLDFKKNLEIGLSCISKMYVVCAFDCLCMQVIIC